MENLIALVNRLQRACTALGDHGEESALPTLWDALPSIAVVGGQVIGADASDTICVLQILFVLTVSMHRRFMYMEGKSWENSAITE